MKVAMICVQRNRVGNVRFQGLWGDTIKREERLLSKKGLEIYNYETREYFPFSEEPLQAIHDLMKENTTYKMTEENGLGKESHTCRKYEGTDVRVRSSLLFTTKQWFNYITNKLVSGSVECNFIEKNLRNLHLERYLRA